MGSIVFMYFLVFFLQIINNVHAKYTHPMEKIHDPERYKPPLYNFVNGTELPSTDTTPDYRVEEPPFRPFHPLHRYVYHEFNRPLRITPHHKQVIRWGALSGKTWEYPSELGCYCTTVYKRLTLLGGCAVLTRTHILTTATSIELVIHKHNARHPEVSLAGILGAWYEYSTNYHNTSLYIEFSRITYHPKYMFPHEVNISHPIPCLFDLALLTTTRKMYYYTLICARGSSSWRQYGPGTPYKSDIMMIVGFQFIKANKKVPMPWYKYVVRTRDFTACAKVDGWGWFSCVKAKYWSRFGLDSGAALHRTLYQRYLYSGLIGLNSFSARLRSEELLHYFTVLDSYPVLEFIYDGYMGWTRYEYLNPLYFNTQGGEPKEKIPTWTYYELFWGYSEIWPEQRYEGYEIPYYKR